jgi:hypothetical protein
MSLARIGITFAGKLLKNGYQSLFLSRPHCIIVCQTFVGGVIFGRAAGLGSENVSWRETNGETYKGKVGHDVGVLVAIARFGVQQVNKVDSAELPVAGADFANAQDGLRLVLVIFRHDTAIDTSFR